MAIDSPLGLSPWRSPLARALHRNRALAQARYLQLATMGLDGRPANRTVVFRGFAPESDRLQLICDRRSQKVEEIHRNPWTEACWYFPKTREQFRLSGSLKLVAPTAESRVDLPNIDELNAENALRQNLWKTLSAKAQSQFYWPTPGQVRVGPKEDVMESSRVSDRPGEVPTTFCLLLLTLDRIDHLDLRGNPQRRYQYILQEHGSWDSKSLNP